MGTNNAMAAVVSIALRGGPAHVDCNHQSMAFSVYLWPKPRKLKKKKKKKKKKMFKRTTRVSGIGQPYSDWLHHRDCSPILVQFIHCWQIDDRFNAFSLAFLVFLVSLSRIGRLRQPTAAKAITKSNRNIKR